MAQFLVLLKRINTLHQEMKNSYVIIVSILLLQCCIPLRVAPKIEDYKITKGRKFKRDLPKRKMFVFEDKTEANEFYNFVNTKYKLDHKNVFDDVPFKIEEQQYFFSFYEVDIPNKSLNLVPLVADVFLNIALGNDNMEPIFSDDRSSVSRKGNWYIAIEVYSDFENDGLQTNSLSREAVLNYLRVLKKEYFSTYSYNEILFRN